MSGGQVTRARDEELLDWVRRRAAGESCGSIARAAGSNPGIVIRATNVVRDADAAESGEDVTGAYW